MPLMIGGGALVVALLIWVGSRSRHRTRSCRACRPGRPSSSTGDRPSGQARSLKSEKQKPHQSCADLEKIATQIPSVQSPTDVDAEESSFESQFNV